MSSKPKFDPSAAFEPVDSKAAEKPKFNPEKSFSIPGDSKLVEETLPEKVAKWGAGLATGVAETMNPATLPRFAETLGRMPFQDVNQDQSFLGRLSERFQKAEKASVIPEFNIGQISAGLRTPITALMDQKSIPEAFAQEMKAQKEYETEFLPKYSKEIGQAGSGILNLASAARQGLAATKVGGAIRSAAKEKAYNALRPLGQAAQKLSKEGRIQPIGEQLLKDEIVTAGASYKDILTRTQNKLKDYGEKIGFFARAADDAAARDSSIRGIPFDDLANDIRSKVVGPLLDDPSTMNAGEDVANWLGKLEKLHGGQDISYQKAQMMKGNLDKVKAKFSAGGDSIAKDAYQEVYGIINDKMESGIANAIKKAAPEIQNDFKDTKTAFRNLKDAEKMIEKTVSKIGNENNRFSLTDMLAGGVGATIGAPLGAVGSGGGAIAAGVANRIAKTRGSQIAASFLNNLGNQTDLSSVKKAAQSVGATNEMKSLMETVLGKEKK